MSESSESPDPSPTVPLDGAGTAVATGLRNRRLALVTSVVVAVLAIAAAGWALWPSPSQREAGPGPDQTTASSGPARTQSPSPSASSSESASPGPSASLGQTGGGASGAWTPAPPAGQHNAEYTLPGAPTIQSVEALNGTTVRVRWADNSDNETKFSVHTWPSIKIFDAPAGTEQYDVGGLMPEAEHCFAVAAFNGPRRAPEAMPYPGPAWTCVWTPPAAPPAAPTGLTVTASANNGTTSMYLQWMDNSYNETRFVLDVGDRPDVVRYPSTLNTNYTVQVPTTVEVFVQYCFTVRAENSAGPSVWSNQACVTPLPAPAAPSNLTVTAISSDTIRLTWSDNSNVEESFVIVRQSHLAGRQTSANVTTYDWTGLQAGTEYCFRVAARNASWTSGSTPGGITALCATTLA